MAFQPVPNTAQVSIEFALPSRPASITLAFVRADPPTEQNLQALLVSLAAWVTTDFRIPFTLTTQITGMVAYALDASDAPKAIYSFNPVATGTIGDTISSAGVAVVVTFDAGVRGRTGRGRVYLPGLGAGAVSQNQLDTARQNEILTAFTNLNAAVVGDGFEHCIISRRVDNTLRPTGITRTNLSYIVRDDIGSQRRRNRYDADAG